MTARPNSNVRSSGDEGSADSADLGSPAMITKEAWSSACRRLRAGLGEAVYNAWFERLDLVSVEDGTATLSVPTTFLKTWIQSHYVEKILAALRTELPTVLRVTVALRSSNRSQPLRKPTLVEPVHLAPPAQQSPAATMPQQTSPATRDAEALGGSPLYIHASVGLGKTHLLQATAQAVAESGRRVIYLTAERFMYGFVASLKAQTALAFKDKLRAIDVLIIDDVQFLQGKFVQTEFCHTLNALIDDGRQVVVAADRPPADLESLEERVRSRLAGGLCVEIEALDETLRQKIVEARVAAARSGQPTFELSSPVVAFVAKVITTNGRDLDGAVNRLMAHATLTGKTHTVESAEAAIRDLVKTREPKRVKIEDIQKLVANHYNISRADILSSRRTATVVRPRQIAMYLAKALTLRSLPEIGRRFGGRDHTTVLHAVRKIETLCGSEAALAEEVELFKRLLQD